MREPRVSHVRGAHKVGEDEMARAEEFLKSLIVSVSNEKGELIPFENSPKALDREFTLREFMELSNAVQTHEDFMFDPAEKKTVVEKL